MSLAVAIQMDPFESVERTTLRVSRMSSGPRPSSPVVLFTPMS